MKINKGGSIANKKSMNLAFVEKKKVNPLKVMIITLGAAIVLVAVAKFGIIDRYEKVNQARNAYQDQQDMYNALLIANADYDDVVIEYNRYSFGAMTEEERAVADRGDVLDLIEKYLISAAKIESVKLEGNNLAVEMSGITLEEASALLNIMLEDELVQYVSVSNANTKDDTSNEAPVVPAANDEDNADENAEEVVERVNDNAQNAKITLTITLADNTIGIVSSNTDTTEEEAGDNE